MCLSEIILKRNGYVKFLRKLFLCISLFIYIFIFIYTVNAINIFVSIIFNNNNDNNSKNNIIIIFNTLPNVI